MGTTTTAITTVSRPTRNHDNQHRRKQAAPLMKQKSWSPETNGDELWQRRKKQSGSRRSKSLTDEDVEELKGCIELGFCFDSPELQPHSKLSQTLPALDFYLTVNRTYNESLLKSHKSSSSLSSSSDSDLSPPSDPPLTFFSPGDDPTTIKTRLRHWAQIVACSVKQAC